ncbi:OmpH domain-containing protein [Pyrenophora tritici-repentis]|nr:OmpH domain-containing protein [Pyrenophora tritici-repentis]
MASSYPHDPFLDPYYPEAFITSAGSNVHQPVSPNPMGNRNVVPQPTGELPGKDGQNLNTESPEILELLKQLVHLMIDGQQRAQYMDKKLEEIQDKQRKIQKGQEEIQKEQGEIQKGQEEIQKQITDVAKRVPSARPNYTSLRPTRPRPDYRPYPALSGTWHDQQLPPYVPVFQICLRAAYFQPQGPRIRYRKRYRKR